MKTTRSAQLSRLGAGEGEEEPQREAPPKRSRLEPAHAGMARRGGEEESLEALEAAALARLARVADGKRST